MEESRWPVVVLFGALWCAGVALLLVIVLGGMWLVDRSALPGMAKGLIDTLLIGFLIPGSSGARRSARRLQGRRSPGSKPTPERG